MIDTLYIIGSSKYLFGLDLNYLHYINIFLYAQIHLNVKFQKDLDSCNHNQPL